MRWKKLGLESHVAFGENPIFPEVSTQIAWIFMTYLEKVLRNADHWAVTLNISKKINYLNGWINSHQEFVCGINFAGIHPLTSVGLCHLCICFALITFLILLLLLLFLLLLSNFIRDDPTSEASL